MSSGSLLLMLKNYAKDIFFFRIANVKTSSVVGFMFEKQA